MTVCFFMSIMFPTIFALGIAAAREQSQIGAAVMVMTIVGGAVVSCPSDHHREIQSRRAARPMTVPAAARDTFGDTPLASDPSRL
jgi:hypothetical protein